jgi:hypothetical protein
MSQTSAPSTYVTAEQLAACYEGRLPTAEVFTADGVYDANVPSWRFQVRGPRSVDEHFRQANPSRDLRATVLRSLPTADGFVAELTLEYTDPRGVFGYHRLLVLAELGGGKISELTVYCTGMWDAATRERYAAGAGAALL